MQFDSYIAARGPYVGQSITVLGPDPLRPDTHMLVRAECGARWGVANWRIDSALRSASHA